MKTQLTYGARYKEGKLSIHKRERLLNEIQAAFGDDVPLIMTIEKASGNKTRQQLAYYFAAVVRGCMRGFEDLGERMAASNARAILETQSPVLKKSIDYDKGQVEIQIPLSRADKYEVSEHIDFCLQWISENLGVYVESPDEWHSKIYGKKPVLK